MYRIRNRLILAWQQAWQRLPLSSLGLYLMLLAMVAAAWTPIYLGQLSSAVPRAVIRPVGGIVEPGQVEMLQQFFFPVEILIMALRQLWLPWVLAFIISLVSSQYFISQAKRVNWFWWGAGSSGLGIFLMVGGLWLEPMMGIVLAIVGFPLGAAIIFLYRELESKRLAWTSNLSITLLSTLFGLILGIWGLVHITQLRAIGIPAGQLGHRLDLVMFPYVCGLGLGFIIALLSPWFNRRSR